MIFQDLAAPNVPVSSLAKPCSHLLLPPHKLLTFLEYMPLCLCLCSSPAEHILVSAFQVSTPGASLLKLSGSIPTSSRPHSLTQEKCLLPPPFFVPLLS